MKIRMIKPVGNKMVPFPKSPYAYIPTSGVRVEYPGPDGYWARRVKEGVIEIMTDKAVKAAATAKAKKEDVKEG